MIIHFSQEFSAEVGSSFNFLSSYDKELKNFFQTKNYGEDLEVLYIGLFCMSPVFDSFFKPRKPRYQSISKVYIEHGVQVEHEGKSFAYELRLNFQKYLHATDIKPLLAWDVLNSLDIIGTIKKIKSFDLALFRNDLEQFFKLNGWLILKKA